VSFQALGDRFSLALRLPPALPADPPSGDGGVQCLRFGCIQFPTVQLGPLEVQPDAQLMFFSGDDSLVAGPVIARVQVGDQGLEPVLPPGLINVRPRWGLPVRKHGQTVAVSRGERSGPGVLPAAPQPGCQSPFRRARCGAGGVAAGFLDHGHQLLHPFQAPGCDLRWFGARGGLVLSLQSRIPIG
jgi:hypothetical protein